MGRDRGPHRHRRDHRSSRGREYRHQEHQTHWPRLPQRRELPDAYPADQRRENRSVNTRYSRVIHHEPRRAPLSYYTGSVYRSSAAILPLLSEGAASARTHNARASFLAGFAVGQEIPTLLLAPKSLNPPLDYKDRMFRFGSAVELTSKIEAWIQNLQKDPSDRRVGRLRVSVEMPISTFGRYVAEEELDALSDYYVPTVQFENILSGSFSTLFLGRKGTGKSAAMEQATRGWCHSVEATLPVGGGLIGGVCGWRGWGCRSVTGRRSRRPRKRAGRCGGSLVTWGVARR